MRNVSIVAAALFQDPDEILAADLVAAACDGVMDELVLVLCAQALEPSWVKTLPDAVRVIIVRSPAQAGKEGAVKRGLFAATGDWVIAWEDMRVSFKEVLSDAFKHKDSGIVLGMFYAHGERRVHQRLTRWLLGEGIVEGDCAFRCVPGKYLTPVLGRIYLERDGFNTEWSYVAHQLGFPLTVVPVIVPWRFDRMDIMAYVNLWRIRLWHHTPVNTSDEHMSDHDVAQMYSQESRHWWFTAKAAFMEKILTQWVPVQDPFVLDAGCGTGHNMLYLAKQGSYVGVDVSGKALSFCQTNGHTRLVQADLLGLPFKPESVDVILSLDVVEHVGNPWSLIRQYKRVLKKDGYCVIAVPAYGFLFGPHDEALSHYKRYSPGMIRSLIEEAGFEVLHENYLYCIPFFPAAIVRLFRKICCRDQKPSTDMYLMPLPFVNELMQKLMALEVWLLGKVPMPFGTSIVVVAKKSGAHG